MAKEEIDSNIFSQMRLLECDFENVANQATQPYSETNSQPLSSEVGWGKLVCFSHVMSKTQYLLDQDIFRAGRSSECDLHFQESDYKESIFPCFSNIHFIIERRKIRNVSVGFIKDVSSNGTFINDKLIGRNNTRVLSHNDVISVAKINYRLFKFNYANDGCDVPDQVKIEYHVVDRIGKGGFGSVFYVLKKDTCQPFAMKMIQAATNIHENLDVFTELKVLQSMKHENIVTFYSTIMKNDKLFLILEYMAGGDLGHLLLEKKRLSEPVARHVFHQIVSGVNYLHNHQIVHRDIKPLNILLSNKEEFPLVKITDFGLSKKLKKYLSTVREIVGTPAFRAPELRNRAFQMCDTRVDVWSLGVLLYLCLSGTYPFSANDKNFWKGKFSPCHIWYHISPFPKNIIEKSLIIDFQRRPYSREILMDRWFKVDLKNYSNSNDPSPSKKLKLVQ